MNIQKYVLMSILSVLTLPMVLEAILLVMEAAHVQEMWPRPSEPEQTL